MGQSFSKEGLCLSPVQHLLQTRGGSGREGRGTSATAAAGVTWARQQKNFLIKGWDSKDSRSCLLATRLDPGRSGPDLFCPLIGVDTGEGLGNLGKRV